MGSAVGQVPDYACMITEWVKEAATIPVMVKLTPNVSDIAAIGRAAVRGGADALSLINTINSIMGVDLNTLAPKPSVRGEGTQRRAIAAPRSSRLPCTCCRPWLTITRSKFPSAASAAFNAWQDAIGVRAARRELGAGSALPPCTMVFASSKHSSADWKAGCAGRGFERMNRRGRQVPAAAEATWGESGSQLQGRGRDRSGYKYIHCGLCYIACEDGAHQSIRWEPVPTPTFVQQNGCKAHVVHSGGVEVVLSGSGDGTVNRFTIKQDVCVGCNLCSLVCPVENCITMKEVATGKAPMSWNQYQKMPEAGKTEKISAADTCLGRFREANEIGTLTNEMRCVHTPTGKFLGGM